MQPSSDERNSFLSALWSENSGMSRPPLRPFRMTAGEYLFNSGDDIGKVIFPHSGIVLLTMPMGNRGSAGAGLIGREGIVGTFAAIAGLAANCNAEVLISGEAVSVSASDYRAALDHSPVLRRLAASFDNAIMAQVQFTAACNAQHHVEERVCRLLLEVQDRVGNVPIPLKQVTIARLLGLRRTTVTMVSVKLEKDGVLRCGRGSIAILQRVDLERRSCECYRQAKEARELSVNVNDHHASVPERAPSAQLIDQRIIR